MEVKLHDERRQAAPAAILRLIGHCADNRHQLWISTSPQPNTAVQHGRSAITIRSAICRTRPGCRLWPHMRSNGLSSSLASSASRPHTVPSGRGGHRLCPPAARRAPQVPTLSSDIARLSAVLQAAYRLILRIPDDFRSFGPRPRRCRADCAASDLYQFPSEEMGKIGRTADRPPRRPKLPPARSCWPPLQRAGTQPGFSCRPRRPATAAPAPYPGRRSLPGAAPMRKRGCDEFAHVVAAFHSFTRLGNYDVAKFLSRRSFLRGVAMGAGVVALAACACRPAPAAPLPRRRGAAAATSRWDYMDADSASRGNSQVQASSPRSGQARISLRRPQAETARVLLPGNCPTSSSLTTPTTLRLRTGCVADVTDKVTPGVQVPTTSRPLGFPSTKTKNTACGQQQLPGPVEQRHSLMRPASPHRTWDELRTPSG
jgi:hypothetical protein